MKPEHDEALVEQVCRQIYPNLFSNDEQVSHRAASPFSVVSRREARRKHIRAIISLIRTTDAARIKALEEALQDAVSTNTENCRQRDALAFHLKATTVALADEIAEYEGVDEPALVAWLGEDMGRRIIRAQMAERAARATLRSNTNG